MEPDDLRLLAACFEARKRQIEMLPLIAAALGVPRGELFYAWALARRQQTESIPNSAWRFGFHGLECDLENTADGRFLRYDFGPGGREDCVTPWGILQFVMTSKAPWQEFPDLRERFALTGPPYDHLSGDHGKISEVWDRLELQGCFEPAAPGLIEFQARYTSIGEDGIRCMSLPHSTPDETVIDCLVAQMPVLSARARELLEFGVSALRG